MLLHVVITYHGFVITASMLLTIETDGGQTVTNLFSSFPSRNNSQTKAEKTTDYTKDRKIKNFRRT